MSEVTDEMEGWAERGRGRVGPPSPDQPVAGGGGRTRGASRPDGDGRLLADFAAGDGRAFEALVHRHQTALLRHARSLVGDGGPWEDVVQDVFLKLAHRPPELEPEVLACDARSRSALAAWLHRVTRNACMDVHRSETTRRARENEFGLHGADRHERAASAPEEERDTRAAVERGLLALPRDQREVLVLRLFAERSYKEIADITGRKVGTVGWLVSVGLKALANELTPVLDVQGELG